MDLLALPLQAAEMCDPSMGMDDYMRSFKFIEAITCEYAGPVGMLMVGALVYGGVSLSLYIRTGNVILPFALLLLTGGAVVSQLAAPAVGFAILLLLTAGAGVVTYLYYVYSR